jgi:hypothetical protein
VTDVGLPSRQKPEPFVELDVGRDPIGEALPPFRGDGVFVAGQNARKAKLS